jgi:ferredoxin
MAKIHFVDNSGETRIIEVENGATVMEAAIRNAIPGIEAECGGACACATCHVYIDGRRHAGFRLRRAAEFAAVVPDQDER